MSINNMSLFILKTHWQNYILRKKNLSKNKRKQKQKSKEQKKKKTETNK